MHGASPSPNRYALIEAVLVLSMLGAFVAYLAPTLDQPLLEGHGFRQTQTAYTARIFHEQGVELLHPKVPVLGEPFEIPFELPLFQAAAAVVMTAGARDDLAMRWTALACFVLTALLLYGLVRHVAGSVSAVAALVAFVLTPFSFIWARASLMEYLATAGAVGFAWATILWRERGRPLPGALALVAGLVGLLVKPTTAVFWIVPALAYEPEKRTDTPSRRNRAWTAILVAIPLAAAVAWTRHADDIKEGNETTSWLASTELREWTLGTLDQRLDPDTWILLAGRLPTVVGLCGVVLLVAAVVATVGAPQRRFWLGIWFAAVAPVLVFTNLYALHDYYLAAVAPAFSALAGFGAGFVWSRLPSRPTVRALAVGIALVLTYGTLELSRGYWSRIDDAKDDPVLQLAREIDGLTRSDELVAVVAPDWNPALLYYAHRWGSTVTERNDALAYKRLRDGGYRYLFVVDPVGFDPTPLDRWPWLGSLGPHSYALADSPRGLRGARIVATDVRLTGRTPIGRDIRIPCHRQVRIAAGTRGTWIVPATRSRATLVLPESEHAPLPIRRAVFVSQSLSDAGELVVTCRGPSSMVVDLIDAPGPSLS